MDMQISVDEGAPAPEGVEFGLAAARVIRHWPALRRTASEEAQPFHLAAAFGLLAAPQIGLIAPLSRDNTSPAEMKSANYDFIHSRTMTELLIDVHL